MPKYVRVTSRVNCRCRRQCQIISWCDTCCKREINSLNAKSERQVKESSDTLSEFLQSNGVCSFLWQMKLKIYAQPKIWREIKRNLKKAHRQFTSVWWRHHWDWEKFNLLIAVNINDTFFSCLLHFHMISYQEKFSICHSFPVCKHS